MSIEDEDGMPEPSGDKGLFGRRDGDGDGPSIRHIPVTVLRENLRQITAGLRDLFDDIAAQPGGLPLREAQVTFEVTASGGIALVGTSAQVAGRGAITLTFGA
ncbi:hypothetical protein [Candidatus Frankia nodulisporulans]|uniref:Pepco domain-containing protein n=1 Tax=Candidatus Frankia nodulisporulans TaxID=2060052 RepID=UPI001CDC6BCF|nr:hypothetical protein [Candidatus Frankia nodulisporulans]